MFTVYRISEQVFGIVRKEDYDEGTNSIKECGRKHGFIAVVGSSYEDSWGVYMSLSEELIASKELTKLEERAKLEVFPVD